MFIHQIWLQGVDEIPPLYRKFSQTIKNKNPQFKHILWDEKKFYKEILNYHPGFRKNYEKLPLIHLKVDYMRYIILYILGGIYVDMDARAIRSFSTIKEDIDKYETVLGKVNASKTSSFLISGHKFIINNGIIISKKESVFLRKLLKTVEKNILKYEKQFKKVKEKTAKAVNIIHKITGPFVFSKVYFNEIKDKKIVKILDSEYFEPCLYECKVTPRTIIYHKQSATWVPEEFKDMIDVYNKKEKLIPLTLIIILLMALLPLISIYFLILSVPVITLMILLLFARFI